MKVKTLFIGFAAVLVIVVVLLVLVRMLAHNYIRKTCRNMFALDRYPLVGDTAEVEVATIYRTQISGRAIEGLIKMRSEGYIWFQELQIAFVALRSARWWLDMKPQFDTLEETCLVQAIVCSWYQIDLSRLGTDTYVYAEGRDEPLDCSGTD